MLPRLDEYAVSDVTGSNDVITAATLGHTDDRMGMRMGEGPLPPLPLKRLARTERIPPNRLLKCLVLLLRFLLVEDAVFLALQIDAADTVRARLTVKEEQTVTAVLASLTAL